MKAIKFLVFLSAAAIFACSAAYGVEINLMFDGISDGGWTLTDSPPPAASVDIHGTGLPGITFDDTVPGYAYYYAPASLFDGVDLTASTLNFNFWIEDLATTSVLADDDVVADLRINGVFLYDLDVIDEAQLGTMQSVSIDFSDPAFDIVDLTNITQFGIRAEYWRVGFEGVESHLISVGNELVSVPEPASLGLVAMGLCGLIILLRRRRN